MPPFKVLVPVKRVIDYAVKIRVVNKKVETNNVKVNESEKPIVHFEPIKQSVACHEPF